MTTSPYAGSINANALYPATGEQGKVLGYGPNNKGFTGNTLIFVTPAGIRSAAGLGTSSTRNVGSSEDNVVALDSGGKVSVDFIPDMGMSKIVDLVSSLTSKVSTSVYDAFVGVVTSFMSSIKPVAFSNSYSDLDSKPTLGTASAQNTSAFATASQGAKADSATQPADLAAGLATKAALVHTHATSGVVSGTFADARIASSNVIQHQAALSIASTQITGTKTSAYISDFNEASQDAVGSILSSDFVYDDAGNLISLRARSFDNAPSHSIVTTAAAANGFQLSSTRDSIVHYSITTTTVVQIGVGTNVSGYVLLEIAATNSTTASDWKEIGRTGNGQNIGLALALSSTQTTPGQLGGVVPTGWYARLRSVNVSGVPTYAYNSGQEVLL